jgi:hypothetical protein
MYLFHFGGTLLRPLYSETRASTIVPECEICKCNSAVGNLWASFHVAQQINAAVKKMTHVHRQLILSSQIYLCYMPTAVPRDLARPESS